MSESFRMKSPRFAWPFCAVEIAMECSVSRLWLLVMFPANFFSFLVDELARLAVWLTASTPGIYRGPAAELPSIVKDMSRI